MSSESGEKWVANHDRRCHFQIWHSMMMMITNYIPNYLFVESNQELRDFWMRMSIRRKKNYTAYVTIEYRCGEHSPHKYFKIDPKVWKMSN